MSAWQWVGVAVWCSLIALGVRKAFDDNAEAGLWQCVAGLLGIGLMVSIAALHDACRRERTLESKLDAERSRRRAFRGAQW